ncbi:hypothetical protein PQ472_12100 [Lacticaseibacillus pabuli]|uniref:DNA-entry nuclease n=1 Tax=Lacticaseibacillus pabuli TaxID=3025672 RepID=A0ABY7WR00_9LACO|nr:hypothetical protein [Lacticaseibacillus sp. KACC 23028]WDF82618.1 hypothetical protein PQ472_12100 [Lacticaseibacillus sp. KACC 23028]
MPYILLTIAVIAGIGGWLLWQRQHHKSRQLALMLLIMAGFCVVVSACSSQPAKPTTRTKTEVVQIGVSRRDSAKAESRRLDAEFEKIDSESASLDSVSSSSVAAASSSAAAASSERAAAASEQAAQAKAASSSRAAAARTAHSAPTNHGDMNTGNTGRIIGNANSKIYHVPGQAGYRMNSSNAVYFSSEAAAIAAGYRRSKR